METTEQRCIEVKPCLSGLADYFGKTPKEDPGPAPAWGSHMAVTALEEGEGSEEEGRRRSENEDLDKSSIGIYVSILETFL